MVHCVTQKSICGQTPYPDLCHSTLEKTQLNVRNSVLKFSLYQAHLAHSHIQAMDVSSFTDQANLAWSDCLELYEDTISQIDRALRSNDSTSSQIWLSAAMTNQQTCENGFVDFNLTSQYLQSFSTTSDDLSNSLHNSLVVNKLTQPSPATTKQIHSRKLLDDEFPKWVTQSKRKLLQSSKDTVVPDIVVSKDGSGDYKTISEAVAASVKKRNGMKIFIIRVKAGVYKEKIEIKKTMKNLMFIGDGIDVTIVTGNKNVNDGSTTFRSATFAISGSGFIARDMTFENTAGPQKHQAVALRSGSDLSVFYRCSFKGYQDTLYLYTQRQFYRQCNIYGTVDFIFGNAAAVLQNCNIYVRKPMPKQKTTITAQSRSNPHMNTGFVIHNSIVTAGSDMKPVQGSFENYLGRPWKEYSRTIFMKCVLDRLITSAGWLPWNGKFGLSTLYYGEYMNTGLGSGTGGRVKWPGHHVITSAVEAIKYTVGNFLEGDDWIPAVGVPFTSGL